MCRSWRRQGSSSASRAGPRGSDHPRNRCFMRPCSDRLALSAPAEGPPPPPRPGGQQGPGGGCRVGVGRRTRRGAGAGGRMPVLRHGRGSQRADLRQGRGGHAAPQWQRRCPPLVDSLLRVPRDPFPAGKANCAHFPDGGREAQRFSLPCGLGSEPRVTCANTHALSISRGRFLHRQPE